MAGRRYTQAAEGYFRDLTQWLQDTRLMSEAVFRLEQDYQETGAIDLDPEVWSKKKHGTIEPTEFRICPSVLSQRMKSLHLRMWSSRFVFLETLWEEYLRGLIYEVHQSDTELLVRFRDRLHKDDSVKNILAPLTGTPEEIGEQASSLLARWLPGQPWKKQWNKLIQLGIGLDDGAKSEQWYTELNTYFLIRNCIVHTGGQTSPELRKCSEFFSHYARIHIWPNHLDHYRGCFKSCVLHIESRFGANYAAQGSVAP